MIKCATGEGRISAKEEQVLRAAARAHKATGCPIITHTTNGMGLEQLDLFESEGVQHLWAATRGGGHVYYSVDGGTSWVSKANDLPDVSATFGNFGNNGNSGQTAGNFAQDLFVPPSPGEFQAWAKKIPNRANRSCFPLIWTSSGSSYCIERGDSGVAKTQLHDA